MPTAKGSLSRVNISTIMGRFDLDGDVLTFEASISPSMPAFTSNDVTLTYDDVEELTTHYAYTGRIGAEELSLELANGPTMTGLLDEPGLGVALSVRGKGSWLAT
ncbi:hypothetical protein AB0D35_17945 [Streptomyces sp. NPDC048301]|uniref:hypothetical protein n=1 Tax=unclassified Streptomyces TaxID=2593676 RepID=UPI003419CA36